MSAPQVNMRLTGYAQGIAGDLTKALARFIAPWVPTGGAHGQFKKFDDKNAFQIHDTARAMGGESKEIAFESTDPYFNCKPQGLKISIDDHERDLAGDNDQLLEQAKVKVLVSAATLSHENKVFTKALSSLTPVAGKGVWSNADVDPVKQINEQIQAIADETGIMPNKIVFGLSAWAVFIDHPKIKERQPGAALVAMTTGMASAMLLNPGIKIEIGILSKDTKKFGAAKTMSNIVGGEVIIFYGEDSPSQYDASFMKTFSTTGKGVDVVKQWRSEAKHSDVYEVNWSEEIQDTAPALGRRISLS
jgi:hypothetical protein